MWRNRCLPHFFGPKRATISPCFASRWTFQKTCGPLSAPRPSPSQRIGTSRRGPFAFRATDNWPSTSALDSTKSVRLFKRMVTLRKGTKVATIFMTAPCALSVAAPTFAIIAMMARKVPSVTSPRTTRGTPNKMYMPVTMLGIHAKPNWVMPLFCAICRSFVRNRRAFSEKSSRMSARRLKARTNPMLSCTSFDTESSPVTSFLGVNGGKHQCRNTLQRVTTKGIITTKGTEAGFWWMTNARFIATPRKTSTMLKLPLNPPATAGASVVNAKFRTSNGTSSCDSSERFRYRRKIDCCKRSSERPSTSILMLHMSQKWITNQGKMWMAAMTYATWRRLARRTSSSTSASTCKTTLTM
mmetsp:Transcript_40657/g.117609  ORF Transcript_40657/g.117609 Transcript_40657/m.117609 type:complete len:356 (-) Transcript_40657:360-1427(-)